MDQSRIAIWTGLVRRPRTPVLARALDQEPASGVFALPEPGRRPAVVVVDCPRRADRLEPLVSVADDDAAVRDLRLEVLQALPVRLVAMQVEVKERDRAVGVGRKGGRRKTLDEDESLLELPS